MSAAIACCNVTNFCRNVLGFRQSVSPSFVESLLAIGRRWGGNGAAVKVEQCVILLQELLAVAPRSSGDITLRSSDPASNPQLSCASRTRNSIKTPATMAVPMWLAAAATSGVGGVASEHMASLNMLRRARGGFIYSSIVAVTNGILLIIASRLAWWEVSNDQVVRDKHHVGSSSRHGRAGNRCSYGCARVS